MNIKLFLLILAIIITVGTFYYTQNLVNDLQNSEREIVELYAKSLEFIASSTSNSNEDFTFIFENIIKRINFPLILTDVDSNPISYSVGSGIKNIEIDSTFTQEEILNFLKLQIRELSEIHEPIDVSYKDFEGNEQIFNKIYFGNSDIIQKLQYYPFLQIIFAFFFVGIAYISFSYLKKTEQSNIWVGMAKEIAHQLGTPISSLMGWTELLKLKMKAPREVLNISKEMESDLSRLNKITNRFSKIGSKPNLKNSDISEVINSVIKYFEKRLPQTGKDVELIYANPESVELKLNSSLFEWVLENLLKNAIDAIGSKKGRIKVSTQSNPDSVEIRVSDNGKGINPKNKNDIFKPGYSTKSRGWGLGLSLAKRIVEDYHKGKLILLNSVPNEGTTFLIILKRDLKN
ncbi:MAG: HAMP domain-containing sensor histidine kinase [Melioribacteraceae bacterium]|nr:HAMP domain-containing sensor histidine kinase [Melioribacteraceae bacterium]